MGLPLFVAPVESDIPKPTEKPASSSSQPPRSAIRRNRRSEERARTARRRAAAVEASLGRAWFMPYEGSSVEPSDRFNGRPPYYLRSPRSRASVHPAWGADAYGPRDTDLRPYRLSPDQEGAELRYWLDSHDDLDVSRPRASRPYENAAASLRSVLLPPLHPDNQPSDDTRSVRRSALPDTISRFARSPPRRSLGRYARRPASNPRSVSFRDLGSRRQQGMDGLGDRNRSISPEGDSAWDTLQTTLTPDPQPPSVGSSFASASATGSGGTNSQSAAGGSSRTSIVEPETTEDGGAAAAEQACESGCEHTDGEENTDSQQDDDDDSAMWLTLESYSARARRSSSHPRRPNLGTDGADDAAERSTRRHPTGYVYNILDLIPTSHERSRLTPGTEARGDNSQATTEAEGEADGTNQSGTVGGQSDDDLWGGMQRIVRNLARREDIPDEWWAEAGLSRTLPQGPSN